MGKSTINAKAVLKDIKSGMTKADLMEKYKLSPKGLESLYKKLIAAGLLKPKGAGERTATKRVTKVKEPARAVKPTLGGKPAAGKARPKRKPAAAKPKPGPSASDLSERDLAIAEDITSGMHDNEILRRHELSPGQFKQIKEELTEAGLLKREAPREGPRATSRRCPACGQDVPATAAKCNHCGEWLDDRADAPLGSPASPAEHGAPLPPPGAVPTSYDDDLEDDEDCPWEERESYGTFSAYFQTATKCLLTPTAFFSRLPTSDGYFNPLLFAIFSMVVSAALGYVGAQLIMGSGGGLFGLIFGVFLALIAAMIFVPIGLFLWSGILHGSLLLVGGAKKGFEATFRTVSYASVAQLFNAIPFVGAVISLWGVVLTVIGLRETHRTTTGKAAAAVAIPVGIALVLAVVAVFSMMSMVKTAFKEVAATAELSGEVIPNEVCRAIEEYMTEVDFAKDMEDAEAAQQQLQQALQDLNDTLNEHRRHPDMGEIRKLAMVYGLATLAESQLGSAIPGMGQALGAADEHRKRLTELCNP